MLTFFRKIRKSFIVSSSARKYLLYAIGEIALVVIGILIALQINNWNEWRKERIEEREVLEGIVKTLETNIHLLNTHQRFLDNANQSGNIILSFLNKKQLASDTLYRHFHLALVNGASDIFISEVGYEYIRVTNGSIIENEMLRQEIIQLFDFDGQMFMRRMNWGIKDDPEVHPFIDDNFERNSDVSLKPYDVESLYDSKVFNSLLKKALAQRSYYISLNQRGKKKLERVLQLIQEELGEE